MIDYTKKYQRMTVGDMIELLNMYANMYGKDTKLTVYAGKDFYERNVFSVDASYGNVKIQAFDTWSGHDENNPDWFKEEYEKDQK